MTTATKKNKELATRIIDELGVWSKQKDQMLDKDVHVVDLHSVIGMTWGSSQIRQESSDEDVLGEVTMETKAQVRDRAIKELAGELDNGVLVLSDTWAEDNL